MDNVKSTNTEDEEEPGESEKIIINEIDGLPNMHPNFNQLEFELEEEENCRDANARTLDELVHDEDLPMSIIVTNVDPRVYKCDDLKVCRLY